MLWTPLWAAPISAVPSQPTQVAVRPGSAHKARNKSGRQ